MQEHGLGGTWHSQFDTPFGIQIYHFQFATQDGSPSAKAAVETGDQKRDVEFSDVKVDGEKILFAEVRQFGDREMRIEYSGRLNGQSLVLTRSFGDRGGQEATATRQLPKPSPEADPAPVVEVKIDRVIKQA